MECIILSVNDTYMDAQEVMHMTDYSKITALYSSLSVGDEDRDGGESNSIQNQKIFLENYARGQHLTNIRHYIDDDESGRFLTVPPILEDLSDPDIDPKDFVFHSLRHTSAAAKLALSHGDYNSVCHAGGWANLEMLTRRYGNHSFANDRLNVAQKMDDFLGGSSMENTVSPANPHVSPEAAEAALKAILQSNPELLIKVAQSIQNC